MVAAYLLRGSVGAASIVETERWAGLACVGARRSSERDLDDPRLAEPFVLLPALVRQRLEAQAVISLAGPIAARVYGADLACELRRTLSSSPTQSVTSSPSKPLSRLDRRQLDPDIPTSEPVPGDYERALAAARALSSRDADLLLKLMRRGTERLVRSPKFARCVDAIARALVEHRSLGGREVRRLLRQATGKEEAA